HEKGLARLQVPPYNELEWAASYFGLADYLTATNQPDSAIEVYRKFIVLRPRSGAAHHKLALILVTAADPKVRDPRQAAQLAAKAVELSSDDGAYWKTLGVARFRAGQWAEAVVALDSTMKKLPKADDSALWFFLAMAHWQAGQKDDAGKWYNQAVQWM